jgi:hypothetical protein
MVLNPRTILVIAVACVVSVGVTLIAVDDGDEVRTLRATPGEYAPAPPAAGGPFSLQATSGTVGWAIADGGDSGVLPLAIYVSGNRLVNQYGTPINVHGVNMSGTEFSCTSGGTYTDRGNSVYGGQPFDSGATYAAMWQGINTVRVPLNEDCWLGINGVDPGWAETNYISAVQIEVNLVHAAGMYVILDLHFSAPGAYCACGQNAMADTDHSAAFWASVATTFKSDPAVIFDLYNEPFLYASYLADASTPVWSCWRNGCAMQTFVSDNAVGPDGGATGYTTNLPWNVEGMQQLITTIRDAGATQPVMVGGLGFAGDLSGWLANVPIDPLGQLVASWHEYPPGSNPYGSCPNVDWDSGGSTGPEGTANTVILPIAALYPVVIGETGDCVTGPTYFDNGLLPWADSYNISYLGWTWNPWTGYTQDVLLTSWAGTPTPGWGLSYECHLNPAASVCDGGTTDAGGGSDSGGGSDAGGDAGSGNFVQNNEIGTGFNVTSQAIPYTSNVSAGDLLVYFHLPNNNTSTSSVTDTLGNSWSLAGSTATTGINVFTAWYTVSAFSGADTVTGYFTSADAFGDLVISDYRGLSPTPTVDTYAGKLQNSTNPIVTGNFTTTAVGDLLVGYFYDIGQGLITGTTYGFDVRSTWVSNTIGQGDTVAGSTGVYSVAATASTTGSVQFASAVAFKP